MPGYNPYRREDNGQFTTKDQVGAVVEKDYNDAIAAGDTARASEIATFAVNELPESKISQQILQQAYGNTATVSKDHSAKKHAKKQQVSQNANLKELDNATREYQETLNILGPPPSDEWAISQVEHRSADEDAIRRYDTWLTMKGQATWKYENRLAAAHYSERISDPELQHLTGAFPEIPGTILQLKDGTRAVVHAGPRYSNLFREDGVTPVPFAAGEEYSIVAAANPQHVIDDVKVDRLRELADYQDDVAWNHKNNIKGHLRNALGFGDDVKGRVGITVKQQYGSLKVNGDMSLKIDVFNMSGTSDDDEYSATYHSADNRIDSKYMGNNGETARRAVGKLLDSGEWKSLAADYRTLSDTYQREQSEVHAFLEKWGNNVVHGGR